MDKATRKELTTMATNISAARSALSKYEAQYADLRLKALRTVESTKVGDTITLEAGNRVLKAKKNAYGRFTVKEAGKIIVKEYMGGNIHDLRFDIAMGRI